MAVGFGVALWRGGSCSANDTDDTHWGIVFFKRGPWVETAYGNYKAY